MNRYVTTVIFTLLTQIVTLAHPLFHPYTYQGGKLTITGFITSSDSTATLPGVLNFPVRNIIGKLNMNQLIEVDNSGKFYGELSLPHPLTLKVDPFGEILMLPGDTLSLWTDIATGEVRMEGSEGALHYNHIKADNNDMLLEGLPQIRDIAASFTREEILQHFDTVTARIETYLMKHPADTTTMSRGVRLAEELTRLAPVTNAFYNIYNVAMAYDDRRYTYTINENGQQQLAFNRNFVPLDYTTVTETARRHRDDITDNPALLLADVNSPWLISAIEILNYGMRLRVMGKIFDSKDNPTLGSDSLAALCRPYTLPRDYSPALHNLQLSNIGSIHTMADEYRILLDKIAGEGNGYDTDCLLGQICLCREFLTSFFPDDMERTGVKGDRMEQLMTVMLPMFSDYTVINQILHRYREFIKETETGDGTARNTITSTLRKIIAPYQGEALFVDFWGIGCGPCRIGMLRQREVVRDLADRPVRFLYIAQDDNDRIRCEKWMAENNIEGEHIFIAPDDWKRLETELNFNAIPFKLLIDRAHSSYRIPTTVNTNEELSAVLRSMTEEESGGE